MRLIVCIPTKPASRKTKSWYYTCSTCARQDKTACKGRSVSMDKHLDSSFVTVVTHSRNHEMILLCGRYTFVSLTLGGPIECQLHRTSKLLRNTSGQMTEF